MSYPGDFKQRFARQIAIPEIGEEGQKKLCKAKVLIVGCGALGSMVAMQLGAAGVGTIGIADYDNVEISNLQRQFFFATHDAGTPKVDVIANRLKELNPVVNISIYKEFLSFRKAEDIFKDYDFIVDATDNPDSKKMIGEVSFKRGKACCIGGVRDFDGQIITLLPGDSRFEDYFGISLADGFLPCSLGGVLGPAAALCASIQASETIKFLTNSGKLLSGRLLTFNLLDNTFKVFSL